MLQPQFIILNDEKFKVKGRYVNCTKINLFNSHIHFALVFTRKNQNQKLT